MEKKETYTELHKLVEKLKNAEDPKRKYEFILWLGKKSVSYTHLTLPTT